MKLDRCFKCKKEIKDDPIGALFGPGNLFFSGNITYNCKSCGTPFCIDCMSQIKKSSRRCPYCKKDIGW